MMTPIQPGQRVYWNYWPHGKSRYDSQALVLDVRKHTARIQVRRNDGKLTRRFVKLARLIERRTGW